MTEETKTQKPHIIAVRIPDCVLAAMERARAKDFSSISEVARRAIIASMRRDGLLDV